jgi:preprotein translocase subunit SecY
MIFVVRTLAILVAGSMFALWISELINDHGFKGQGSNLIILAGVIDEIAKGFTLMQSGEMSLWSARLFYALIMVACMVILVYLARGNREVPIVQTGKRSRLFSARHSALPPRSDMTTENYLFGQKRLSILI